MTIVVERLNVGPRLVSVALADGDALVMEGVEYHCSCGCLVTFGLRLNGEKAATLRFCERHHPLGDEIKEVFLGRDAPPLDTDLWLGAVLEAADDGDLRALVARFR